MVRTLTLLNAVAGASLGPGGAEVYLISLVSYHGPARRIKILFAPQLLGSTVPGTGSTDTTVSSARDRGSSAFVCIEKNSL